MKVELKIYLTQSQRRKLAFFNMMLIGLGEGLKKYILPFIEIAAAVVLLISMCCMDSSNLELIIITYGVSGAVLIASHIFRAYIDMELKRLRRARIMRTRRLYI